MVKKRKKRSKSAKLPIPRNIFFRKIDRIDLFLNTVLGRGALEVSPERNIFLAPARFQNLSRFH